MPSSSEKKIVRNTRNLFLAIADKCGLSERTIRSAFGNKPVTWQTAVKIAKALDVDLREIRIKADNRGRRQKKGRSIS